jgi:uncharacterized membrane protein
MNTKQTGFIIIGISILLFVVMISFIKELQATAIAQCGCVGGTCPMEDNLPIQGYLGITLSVVIGIFGGIQVLTSKKMEKIAIKKSERIKKMLKTLKEDQKKIYDLIESSDGAVFQSELVERSKFSKVKVSRILDKLEGKGLVIRRRRGMSNIVILKHH